MSLTDWIVVCGGALLGWGVVSWLINVVRQQRAPPVPMGTQSPPAAAPDHAPAPVPAPESAFEPALAAPSSGRISLAELGSTWHQILGVSPDASLGQIEAAYRERVAECERNAPKGGNATQRSRLDEAFEFIRTLRQQPTR